MVNGSGSLIEKLTILANVRDVYSCNYVNHVVNIKNLLESREDKEDREGIPRTHPIP